MSLPEGPDPDNPQSRPNLYPKIESVQVNPWIERIVRDQYAATMFALTDGQMLVTQTEKPEGGDTRPPTPEEAIAILSNQITGQQIEFAMTRMREPKMVMKPKTNFQRYVSMLDTGTRFADDDCEQWNTFVSKNRRFTFASEDKRMQLTDRIIGWDLGIGEGSADLEGENGAPDDLLKRWYSQNPEDVLIVSPMEWALLTKLGIISGKPIDRSTHTLCRLNFYPQTGYIHGQISICRWDLSHPSFSEVYGSCYYENIVFRPIVVTGISWKSWDMGHISPPAVALP